MTEEENTCKISVPLLSDYEIRQIDNHLDDIVSQFTKQLVHDKDLAIAQHIIQKQQEEIKLLKDQQQYVIDEYSETIEKKDNRVKSIINRLDNDIKNITETKAKKNEGYNYLDNYTRCRLKAYRTKTREIRDYIKEQYFES